MPTRSFFQGLILFVASTCLWTVQPGNALAVSDPDSPGAIITLESVNFTRDVQPILEMRCVACHACYDASCQLKLSSYEGITRGISQEQVYDAKRLTAAQPTRLYEDAQTTDQWRQLDFHPVLNEGEQNPATNLRQSLLARTLLLKAGNPLPTGPLLGDQFTLGPGRDQQCVAIEDYEDIESQYPLWGMPYGLPGLSSQEQATLLQWISDGAPGPAPSQGNPDEAELNELARWEAFLNADDLKSQLVARYIYEHLFPASLYFADLDGPPAFFRLVRSSSPPGSPLAIINTRLPFSNPGVSRVYYRLMPVRETVVMKSHMPYALDAARMARWKVLFMQPDFEVEKLPSYEETTASNPFITFAQLPAPSRYRFMLDEAQYTVMAYIKGPVCRGQTAVDVINDHFWVFFSAPDEDFAGSYSPKLESILKDMKLPAAAGSTSMVTNWLAYSHKELDYLEAKTAWARTSPGPSLRSIWDGDGENANAALTVFRHNDNAEVVKGLQGDRPQTAWVVNYPLLERIHYLLVAGYDVFGNVGHQLNTRIYMDFLRIEGESNFLSLLPDSVRGAVLKHWYRDDVSHRVSVLQSHSLSHQASAVAYQSNDPLAELYQRLEARLQPVHDRSHDLDALALRAESAQYLQRLSSVSGRAAAAFPEYTVLMVRDHDAGGPHFISLLGNRAFTNISHLMGDDERRLPNEDTLSVHPGFMGSYPNAFVRLGAGELPAFVAQAEQMRTEADFARLLDSYGVRRTDPNFWAFSDLVQTAARKAAVSGGLLDYNRLENR